MSRWLAVVVALAACKVKKHEEPPVAEMTPIKPVASDEVAPVPEVAMPSAGAKLPPACQDYHRAVERLVQCPKIPEASRQAMRDAMTQMESSWTALPDENRAPIDAACRSAADAIEQAVTSAGCGTAAVASRNVPGEKGVPFDRRALGSLPHPFGALEILKPGISRDEILSALPDAQRDGEDGITVPVGVDDLVARIDLDFTGHLDVVRIQLPEPARELLAKAWGKPSAAGAWFDRKKRWRADLDDSGELMIGPFTPLAELLGKGPDGLAESKAILGATPEELTARFGARVREIDADSDDAEKPPAARYELLVPATEVCKFYTYAEAQLTAGRVSKLHLTQCYDDEAQRRAALAAMESRWGKVVPGRSSDDRPVFTFAVPGRKIEMTIDEQDEAHPGWQLAITR